MSGQGNGNGIYRTYTSYRSYRSHSSLTSRCLAIFLLEGIRREQRLAQSQIGIIEVSVQDTGASSYDYSNVSVLRGDYA